MTGDCPRCGGERTAVQVALQARRLHDQGPSLGRRCKSLCEPCAAEIFSALTDTFDRETTPLVDGPYRKSMQT